MDHPFLPGASSPVAEGDERYNQTPPPSDMSIPEFREAPAVSGTLSPRTVVECLVCNGTGVMRFTISNSIDPSARIEEEPCDVCGGSGAIEMDEDDEPDDGIPVISKHGDRETI